jgi:hypothetical protein
MKSRLAVLTTILACAVSAHAAAQSASPQEQEALRARIERRFDVFPLTNGVGLRPKTPMRDVRLIEISDIVLVNGTPVSGRELADRLGADADAVLRLTYLDADARRALFAAREPEKPAEPEAERTVEPPAPQAPSIPPEVRPQRRRSNGDRVRVLGDVAVSEGENVSGQVVAVLGDVRIDGEVGDQVVAVLGSVDLGPHAIVRGDIVTVGGRLHRADGAQVRGGITEVALGNPGVWVSVPWFDGWGPRLFPGGFGATARLIATAFRYVLLALVASVMLVIARRSVEGAAQRVSDNPVKATLVGFAAWIVFIPLFTLTVIVLAVSIIGIPLLVLVPFAVLALIIMAIAGFSGTAYAVGQWARRRLGLGAMTPIADLWLGILVILMPVFLGRVAAIGGWPLAPIVFLLLAAGLGVEAIAWASGFGAVLTNSFSRWQATRATRAVAQPPVTPPPIT